MYRHKKEISIHFLVDNTQPLEINYSFEFVSDNEYPSLKVTDILINDHLHLHKNLTTLSTRLSLPNRLDKKNALKRELTNRRLSTSSLLGLKLPIASKFSQGSSGLKLSKNKTNSFRSQK